MWNGDPIRCSQCGREIDLEKIEGFVPSISGGIMGDEYIESYYLCTHCDLYTIEVIHDRFLGEEDVSLRGPVSNLDRCEEMSKFGHDQLAVRPGLGFAS